MTFVISDDSLMGVVMYVRGKLAKTVSFSTNPTLVEKLDAYCSARGCSRSWFMSQALETYLNECLEDKEDYETAAAAWSEFEKSGGKAYSSAEVRKELGL